MIAQMDIRLLTAGETDACEEILRALPAWFGIESAIVRYLEDIGRLPTWGAWLDGNVVGFITLVPHSAFAAEIEVMAVREAFHRRGIGRALVQRAEAEVARGGGEYLQVKTLGPSHPDAGYARTRSFYQALGFRPLEELTSIWGPTNPCLILVKRVG